MMQPLSKHVMDKVIPDYLRVPNDHLINYPDTLEMYGADEEICRAFQTTLTCNTQS